jgi:hypothetical protein
LAIPDTRRNHLDTDDARRWINPAGRRVRSSDAIVVDRSTKNAGDPGSPDEEDAEAALALLKDLVVEFPFVDDEGVSRAVGLSAIISPVCRAPTPWCRCTSSTRRKPGTGKSYLSCASWIATGQAMPALGSDSQEELDKRLDAAVLSGGN